MSFALQLFGLPNILFGNKAQPLKLSNPGLLLLYLVLKADWVSRAELAFLFRPDEAEVSALKHLRLLLHRAKQFDWAEALEVEQHRLRLLIPTDIAEFKRAIQEENWPLATGVYSATLLDTFSPPDLPTYGAWLDIERAELEMQYLYALEVYGKNLTLQGNHTAAAQVYTDYLRLEPFNEEIVQAYLRSLYLSANKEPALKAFENFRLKLKAEFDAEPLDETLELITQIKKGSQLRDQLRQDKTTPKLRAPLERASTRFIGRSAELQSLHDYLQDETCRLITLVGLGGSGKTRLALELARLVQDSFKDGACFLALAPIGSKEAFLSSLAQALGLTLAPKQAPEVQIQSFLADKELLLVLDNFEHLLSLRSFVSELLEANGKIKILISSRESLNLSAEWLFDVEGLDYPRPDDDIRLPSNDEPLDLKAFPAIELFINSAKRINPRLNPSQTDLQSITKISQLLEGHPLALELAAAWLKTLSLETIAENLRQNPMLLEGRHSDLPERQRNLKAIFEQTWNALSEKKRQTLAQFSLFRGGATLEAAETITGTHFSILLSLVNESLLRRIPPDRFDMHELLKQFASDHLDAALKEAASERYCHFYLDFAKTETPRLHSEEVADSSRNLKLEQDNFRAVLDYALITGNGKFAQDLCGALRNVWLSNGQAAEGLTYTHEALALDSSPSGERARALRTAASLTLLVASYAEGEALLYESLELFKRLEDQENIIGVLNDLTLLYTRQGNHDKAKELGETALTLAQSLTDPFYISMVHNSLGGVELYLGNYQASQTHYETALSINRDLGFKWSMASNLGNLSMIFAYQGKLERAISFIEEEIAIKRELNSLAELAVPLMSLGETLSMTGNYEGAFKHLEEALYIAKQVKNLRVITYILSVMAKLKMDLADYPVALTYAQEALELAKANDFAREAITAHNVLMYSNYREAKDFAKSLEHGLAATRLCEASRSKVQLSELQLYLAQCLESYPETSVTLISISKVLQDELDIDAMEIVATTLAKQKERLRPETYQAAWEKGQALSFEESSSFMVTTLEHLLEDAKVALTPNQVKT